VTRSTRLTHSDPKAEYGALAVALAAQCSTTQKEISGERYLSKLSNCLEDSAKEFLELIMKVIESVRKGDSTEEYADSIGLDSGVTGYVYHTVPVAIHTWLSYQNDYQEAVMSVIRCGGDTDTTAAIVGGIVGAGAGAKGIPQEWIEQICEWPLSTRLIEQLGNSLSSTLYEETKVVHSHWPPHWKRLLRNFVFLSVVLFHGFRRLLPPY
jgi:ADP-ribosylglycohydrolase